MLSISKIKIFIAVLVLCTFTPLASVSNENASFISKFSQNRSINFLRIQSAEAYDINIISYNGLKAAEDDTLLGRLGIVGKFFLVIIGIGLLIACWPVFVAGAIIWAIVSWLFFGPSKDSKK